MRDFVDYDHILRHVSQIKDNPQMRLQLWQHWDRKLPNNPFVTRQRDAAIAASPAVRSDLLHQ